MSIQHIVLLKWKPSVTHDQVLEAFRHAEQLPNEIAGLEGLSIGRTRIQHEHGYTHAIIVRLASEQALEGYLDHPLRRSFHAEHLEPIEEERIEIDVPVDAALHQSPGRNWEWGASAGMGGLVDDT